MNEIPAATSYLVPARQIDRSHIFCGCGFRIKTFMGGQLFRS